MKKIQKVLGALQKLRVEHVLLFPELHIKHSDEQLMEIHSLFLHIYPCTIRVSINITEVVHIEHVLVQVSAGFSTVPVSPPLGRVATPPVFAPPVSNQQTDF